jgi:hypothetical protein
MYKDPYIIEFAKIGKPAEGYISVAEKNTLPFSVKRIYWTYYTPESVERGGHAHYELEQILVAVSGRIIVGIETIDRKKFEFVLDNPSIGLYVPKSVWRTLKYTHNAVQMCIASMEYSESDYIRNYSDFKSITL